MMHISSHPMALPPNSFARIAAHGLLDPRTVAKAYDGGPLRPMAYERVCKAALALGLDPPPPPASAPAKAGARGQ